MTLSIATQRFFVLNDYISSLWNQKPDKFASLLTPNVKLTHYTNDVLDHEVEGKERVIELFSKNFFNSLVSIDLASIKFMTDGQESARYKLKTTQQMNQNGEIKQIKYEDDSEFKFDLDGGVLHIAQIVMRVTKDVVN